MDKKILSESIKRHAKSLGFVSCGISPAGFLEDDAVHLENWLKSGFHGKMSYMENHFDLRLNPQKLMPGTKSVISVLLNYYPAKNIFEDQKLKISKYAYGEDYHIVVKEKLKKLLSFIEQTVGEVSARCFTDSAPVLEKSWAKKSGLGWIGKNGNLITQQVGSFYFLGEILIDIDLEPDGPVDEHCGTCVACIEACPTDAIIKPYVVDGSSCISYLTIELKDEFIPEKFKNKTEGWVFGCDICQDVCPWNRFSKTTDEERFFPLIPITTEDLTNLTQESFNRLFKDSPIKRTKFSGWKRNISFIDLTKK